MACKVVGKKIYVSPTSVVGEAVGTGDGTIVDFTLANAGFITGSLIVYLDGTETTEYTAVESTGVITFSTAPGEGVAVTADYTYGVDPVVFTATGTIMVVGMQITNVSATLDDVGVSVLVGETHIAKNTPVPMKASFAPIAGKLVLTEGDTLSVFAANDDCLELVFSYLEM